MSELADAPMQIATPSDFQIEQVAAEATNLVRKSGLKLLLIDSLQWMMDCDAPATISAETILWRRKKLAEVLKIPIIVSAHAQRLKDGTFLVNPIEQLDHDDAIERVADVVVLLDRPDQDDREHPRAGETDLRVVKNRNGPVATVTVAHQFHYWRFVDMVSAGYPVFPVKRTVKTEAASVAEPTEPDNPDVQGAAPF